MKKNKRDAAIEQLLAKWEEDVQGYPQTEGGLFAKAAVQLCAAELRQALGMPPKGLFPVEDGRWEVVEESDPLIVGEHQEDPQ